MQKPEGAVFNPEDIRLATLSEQELMAENKRLRYERKEAEDECDVLDAEIVRLQAALEDAAVSLDVGGMRDSAYRAREAKEPTP